MKKQEKTKVKTKRTKGTGSKPVNMLLFLDFELIQSAMDHAQPVTTNILDLNMFWR